VDAISNVFVFVKFEKNKILYDHNNPWIISFNVKNLQVLTPPIKNKQINVLGFNYFLCIISININIFSSFKCLTKF
jgi:hypothetical protein